LYREKSGNPGADAFINLFSLTETGKKGETTKSKNMEININGG
jgi:hypothetical protein